MHISEGVLSAPVLITGAGLTAVGLAISLKKMDNEDIPGIAVITAGLFVASLIHIPLGPSSVHLLLNGIAGIILSWHVFPAFLVALFLQAVLFQFGGITVLGVNTLILALPAILGFYLFKLLNHKNELRFKIASFSCTALAVLLTALLAAFVLMFTEEAFLHLARMIILTHIPLIVLEGIVGLFCLSFIRRIKPEMIEGEIIYDQEND